MKNNKPLTFIISLLAAIVLWIYVVTVVNPDGERLISNIPVTFSGQEVLREDQGLLIMGGGNMTVSATFHGKNSELNKLVQTQEDLYAVVDVTRVRSDREYRMSFDIQFPSGVDASDITVTDKNPSTVSFSVEKLVRAPIEVRGDFSAVSVAEGYMLDKTAFDFESIQVEGPKSVVDTIDCALVTMNRTNLEKSVTETVAYVLVDKDGDPVDTTELTVDVNEIDVTLSVVKYKDVLLDVAFIDGGGATSMDVSYKVQPDRITLSGDATVLDGINNISLGTIDLSQMLTNSDTITLPILIPNDAKNVTGVEDAQVEIEIKNKETASIRVGKDSFSFVGGPADLEPGSVTQQLNILVRADAKDIAKINSSNIRVVADLSSYTSAGTHTVNEVTVYIDGYPTAGVIGDYALVVTLAEPADDPAEKP